MKQSRRTGKACRPSPQRLSGRHVLPGEVACPEQNRRDTNRHFNKLYQGALPLTKSLVEVTAGQSTYPQVFDPRPVRDRWQLRKQDRRRFILSLSPKERERLRRAEAWHRKVYVNR
jgi:hypothetical protein